MRQTVEDCLTRGDGRGRVPRGAGRGCGRPDRARADRPARAVGVRARICRGQPYSFLDDAPLEERRTQAVLDAPHRGVRVADTLGALDPEAVARVHARRGPTREAEEVHEALLWMGYVTGAEAPGWAAWLAELARAGRVVKEGERWFAVEATRDPEEVLRGRLEALGPVREPGPTTALAAAARGARARAAGAHRGGQAWCDRRLLARIHRVHAGPAAPRDRAGDARPQFLRFLAGWQHVDRATGWTDRAAWPRWCGSSPGSRCRRRRGSRDLAGPRAGLQARVARPAHARRRRRVGPAVGRERRLGPRAPLALVPREQLETWAGLAAAVRAEPDVSGVPTCSRS